MAKRFTEESLTFLYLPDPPEVEKPEAEGGGTFDGYWETFSVQQTSVSDESTVIYAAYRCDIGDPFGKSTGVCVCVKGI